VTYLVQGRIGELRLPPPRPPRFTERLWEHTCCEIFVAASDFPAYHEFNFSPSGEWAAYAFESYRNGGSLDAPDPGISVRAAAERLELQASIDVPAGKLRLGVSAVIEEANGRRSYWALRHPPGGPDFHHAGAFVLELD
jgi:hypothetical protein